VDATDRLPPHHRASLRLMRVRAAAVRARLHRPADTPQAFASGRRSLRLLLVGSGPAAGWGVASHDLALPGALARAVATSTGRGCVVDVIPHPSAGARRVARTLRHADLDRYDAVVVSATIADAVRAVHVERWAGRVREALRETRRTGPRTVVWLGAHPLRALRGHDPRATELVHRHAEVLNRRAEAVCREEGALFVPLATPPEADGGRLRGPADYLFWGRQIADRLVPALEERPAVRLPAGCAVEARVEAIERLRLTQRTADPRLDDLVSTARRTLGTEIAMLTVLDAEKEWPLAAVGATPREIPIEQSACLHTLRSTDGMAVPDAERDERFAGSELVTGPSHLRFYAGYPVEAPDGTRIGAFCVFGRSPRDPAEADADLDVLRELALLAQRELWRFAVTTA
jgi:hypothetical protein